MAIRNMDEETLLTELGERLEATTWEKLGEFLGKVLKEVVCLQAYRVMPTKPDGVGEREWKWPEVVKALERALHEHRPAIYDREK